MPNRIVREGIITSKPVNVLSWPAEVFYRRLLSVVDDFGRYYAEPMLLRAACYPLQLNKVGDPDIAKWLGETRKAGLVRVYTVNGSDYLEVDKFGQRVRAEKSKFPQPPPDVGQMTVIGQSSAHVVVDVVEDVVGSVGGSRKNGARHAIQDDSPIVITLPLRDGGDFEVRQSLVALLEPLYPAVDVPQTLREMKGWLVGNPDRRKVRRGIRRFITHWLQTEQEKHGG